jgi:hypothetical protein
MRIETAEHLDLSIHLSQSMPLALMSARDEN